MSANVIEAIKNSDVLIVGTGFTGATYANKLSDLGYHVVMIDKRDHIAGNAHTPLLNDIYVHQYGAHIFHTPNEEIWNYVADFDDWYDYRHRVLGVSHGEVYSLPFTLKTMSEIFGGQWRPEKAKQFLDYHTNGYHASRNHNLEMRAKSLVGAKIYETLIRDYTKKQWGVDPSKLDPSIISRLPIRMTYDTSYFNDAFQGIPVRGYTNLIWNMTANAEVFTGIDWFELKNQFPKESLPYVIYTGPVDQFFDYKHGKLSWRSVRFENEYLEKVDDYQGIAVMNYCDDTVPYTRIIEHKHFDLENKTKGTWISREFSCDPNETIDPYYPINLESDKMTMKVYEIEKEKIDHNYWICGRLGDYRYYDMHQAIGIVWKDFKTVQNRIDLKITNRGF